MSQSTKGSNDTDGYTPGKLSLHTGELLLTLCLQAKLGSVLETFNLSPSFDPLISGPFLPVCFYFSPS